MKKRRQFRLRHRTQRSLGKKEKITTQKIGKYTARYCDILNRNNRKRQKERVSRHQGRKSRRLHKKTRQRPTAASGREAARHINPEYDLRLIRKTRRIARRKTSAVTEKSQPIIENHLNAKMRNADKQSKNKARQAISKGKFPKRSKAQKHGQTRSRRKKIAVNEEQIRHAVVFNNDCL